MKKIITDREERKLTKEEIDLVENTVKITPRVLLVAERVVCKIRSVVQFFPSALANDFKSYAMLTSPPFRESFSRNPEADNQLARGLGLRSPAQVQQVATFCRNYHIFTQED